jgi:hypothetical protein
VSVTTSCAHTLRTSAPATCRRVPPIPARPLRSAPGQAPYAAHRPPSRQDRNHAANAVWVRAHPGFKSPSLRASDLRERLDDVPHRRLREDQPAASGIVAAPWRRSWNRMGGRAARVPRAANRWEIHEGRSGVPSSRVNTRPESVHSAPNAPGALVTMCRRLVIQ